MMDALLDALLYLALLPMAAGLLGLLALASLIAALAIGIAAGIAAGIEGDWKGKPRRKGEP